MAVATRGQIDEQKLMGVLGQVVGDLGAICSASLVLLGDELGLYRALAEHGPLSAEQLGERAGIDARYARPWLINQAAAGYVDYDAASERFGMSTEQAAALADETSPFYVLGGFELAAAAIRDEPRVSAAIRSGNGLAWGDHDPGMYSGTERFFGPYYTANLVPSWIPALDGVQEKLERGAMVADVGCGHGVSTIILARAYPNSRFFGFDNHAPSIEHARNAAQQAGVADRVTFAVASAQEYPGSDYDLVALFDCLHDMGDPVGALQHARQTLAADGTALIVEPMAGERTEDNLNPVGRIYSAGSVLVCTPHALASGGHGLGTLATDAQVREVVLGSGFTQFRRATETPFNRVFEARP